jgi:hypothetical protein
MDNAYLHHNGTGHSAFYQGWPLQINTYNAAAFSCMPSPYEGMIPTWNIMPCEPPNYADSGFSTICHRSYDMSSQASDDDNITTASGDPSRPVTEAPVKGKCLCECGKSFGRPQDMYRHMNSVGKLLQRPMSSHHCLLTVLSMRRITMVSDGNVAFANEASRARTPYSGTW